MEFRYRAIDGDRPPTTTDPIPTQPPNPSFSSLSARPISGCNLGPNEVNLREAIQREIEKQQIRHEIIIAETARRRELINEVVQEMAIEREMAIRRVAETGMSLEDKLTMWINQRKMLTNQNQNNNNNNLFGHKFTYNDPLMYTGQYSLATTPMMQSPYFQQIHEATPVLKSYKDKTIVLNRTDHIGAKRKAEDTQTVLERAKRKPDSVCLGRDPHLFGPENNANETSMKAKLMGTGETVSSKLHPCLMKLASGKQVESKPKPKFKFWCDLCGVGAFSKTVMRNHELGKKHITAIEKRNETASPSSIVTSPAPKPEAVTILENANVQNDGEIDETEAKETGEKKKKVRLWCEICSIQTYSEQVMETHRLGKKHKALLLKQQKKPIDVLQF